MLFFLCYVRILWYSVKEMLNDLFRLDMEEILNVVWFVQMW